jgi:hypothetical protein
MASPSVCRWKQNKGRLAIDFLTIKAGFPLFAFEDKSKYYNSLSIEQYPEKRPSFISACIEKSMTRTMKRHLKMEKRIGENMGFRMLCKINLFS